MVAVRSRRALVVLPEGSSEASLGHALSDRLHRENVPLLMPTRKELDWQNEKDVLNYFALHRPDTVVCAFPQGAVLYQQFLDASSRQALQTLLQNVVAACWKSQCKLIFWSDYHVFGGETKSSYSENDTPAPLDAYGEFLVALEQQVVEQLEHYIILRFSWLVDSDSENLFTRALDCLSGKAENCRFSSYRRGSPTWRDDALRVVYGVARQVMSGANNWGYFHYCSADHCNQWEFAETVAAIYQDLQPAQGELVADTDKASPVAPEEPASATLTCRRIRNNFGVHGRSWRQGLRGRVRQWLQTQGMLPPEADDE